MRRAPASASQVDSLHREGMTREEAEQLLRAKLGQCSSAASGSEPAGKRRSLRLTILYLAGAALTVSAFATAGCLVLTSDDTGALARFHPRRRAAAAIFDVPKARADGDATDHWRNEARRNVGNEARRNADPPAPPEMGDSTGDGCQDNHLKCGEWAAAGECQNNADFMLRTCRRACGKCKYGVGEPEDMDHVQSDCQDKSSYCGQWAAVGECDSNPSYMRINCKVTCHLCQSKHCHDADVKRCAAEAARGLCSSEPTRMYDECRWACRWCAMTTASKCLRPNASHPAAWPGSTNAMFERALTMKRYTPVVHSRPPDGPWVVTFDTFLSAEESAAIVNKGAVHWGRSQAGDGVQAVRTSSTAWCEHTSSCGRDPAISAVRARIADLTGVPERNAEHLQVLKYEKGQFYRRHHDQNSPATSMWGPRTYTFFMYMNDADNAFPGRKDDPRDVPLQGGETHFPVLNKTISPRMGRALLWPSILDETPLVRDDRTDHEALTVVDGVKYAANYWLHLYDFQEANKLGCGNQEVFGNWGTEAMAPRS